MLVKTATPKQSAIFDINLDFKKRRAREKQEVHMT